MVGVYFGKVYKPDSVPLKLLRFSNHLSVAFHPTASRQVANTVLHELAPHEVYLAIDLAIQYGELLPRLFTLTPMKWGGLFSVALSIPILLPKLSLNFALRIVERGTCWCPDFPPHYTVMERLPNFFAMKIQIKKGNLNISYKNSI